ncbi:hypothetical protein K402DRAFT_390486 [Aulographum hederae CBS 113979]|uniref:U4/U6.U5 small nuclear ribonucleoprotein 27kDa protein domain-containing protein n=1 Tax=Aulographum hederae CBS 113979 TaxID=1176131 RepID=A0A6G1HAZ6_9PEZI|nr:hypothetical protein K402DRAFT_390486 [Aulographum hederae CBS 113979]
MSDRRQDRRGGRLPRPDNRRSERSRSPRGRRDRDERGDRRVRSPLRGDKRRDDRTFRQDDRRDRRQDDRRQDDRRDRRQQDRPPVRPQDDKKVEKVEKTTEAKPKAEEKPAPAAAAAAAAAPVAGTEENAPVDLANLDYEDNDAMEAAMMEVMGFAKFNTTKDTKVPGNDKNYGVFKVKSRDYRQYMNRQGGFNRPLSPGK